MRKQVKQSWQMVREKAWCGPVAGKDSSKLQVSEEVSCFEYILAFMNSETLVESEDTGMAVLLKLNDT